MDATLKNKLIEITWEKFLIALLIMLVGFLLNMSLEKYKLIEAQRINGMSEIVKACAEIWAKVYDYESNLNEVEYLKNKQFILKRVFKANDLAIETQIKQKQT